MGKFHQECHKNFHQNQERHSRNLQKTINFPCAPEVSVKNQTPMSISIIQIPQQVQIESHHNPIPILDPLNYSRITLDLYRLSYIVRGSSSLSSGNWAKKNCHDKPDNCPKSRFMRPLISSLVPLNPTRGSIFHVPLYSGQKLDAKPQLFRSCWLIYNKIHISM